MEGEREKTSSLYDSGLESRMGKYAKESLCAARPGGNIIIVRRCDFTHGGAGGDEPARVVPPGFALPVLPASKNEISFHVVVSNYIAQTSII